MRGQIILIAIFSATAAMAQAPQGNTEAAPTTQMATPPPVSGVNYATQVGFEVRRNYLRGGITYTTSYIDNYFANSGSTSVAETTISVLPTIAYDTTTARQHAVFTYSPGFTFYRPSSALNEVDNLATVDYDFRLTAHTAINVVEKFQDSSSPLVPSEDGENGSVSGAPVSSTPGVTPPFAKRLTNFVNAEITMQTGLNDMIGVSGLSTVLHYPNPSQTPNLYDSSSRGGTAFYSHRVSASQYIGVTYQFMDLLTTPTGSESTTGTSTVMGYYTIYPKARLSLSAAIGPQYYQVTETAMPTSSSWGPSASTSMGWQSGRASFAAGYSQSVTGAGGLLGAYHTRSASASVRWQLAHTWTAGASGSYSINKSVSSMLPTAAGNGHSVSGSATLQHPIRGHVSVTLNYDRAHQSYGEVAAIAANPDVDRVSISITWDFLRPLGK